MAEPSYPRPSTVENIISPNGTNFNSPTNFNCINNINNNSFNNSNNFNLVSPTELYSIPTRIAVGRNNLPKLRPRFHARKVIVINSSSKDKTSSLPSLLFPIHDHCGVKLMNSLVL